MPRYLLAVWTSVSLAGCTDSRVDFAVYCDYPIEWNGSLVCDYDWDSIEEDLRAASVSPFEMRPGSRWKWSILHPMPERIGEMDAAVIRTFGLPVWLHGDSNAFLRSLRGMGPSRMAAWRETCEPLYCCNPLDVSGIGEKTIAAWESRAYVDISELGCVRWSGEALASEHCQSR